MSCLSFSLSVNVVRCLYVVFPLNLLELQKPRGFLGYCRYTTHFMYCDPERIMSHVWLLPRLVVVLVP